MSRNRPRKSGARGQSRAEAIRHQQFFEEEFGQDAPAELEGEKIGYIDAKYKDSLMPEQRRYTLGPSIFGLPSPQRSAASWRGLQTRDPAHATSEGPAWGVVSLV